MPLVPFLDRQQTLVAEAEEVEYALSGAIKKRMLGGCGTPSKASTIDGVLQATFDGVTDDTHGISSRATLDQENRRQSSRGLPR
jgi:hypothetical protein